MILKKLHDKHGETIPDYAMIEAMNDFEFNVTHPLKNEIENCENSMVTAKNLLDEALKQIQDKQGGTRCKMDMAKNILRQELARITDLKLKDEEKFEQVDLERCKYENEFQ